MAQTAQPAANATDLNGRSPQKQVRGNSRIGPGQGGTDRAVVVRLPYDPVAITGTRGETKDSRFRTGPR